MRNKCDLNCVENTELTIELAVEVGINSKASLGRYVRMNNGLNI
jgi:hypothetical protein